MHGIYSLDLKDRKILMELGRDARQSYNQIGKRVGLSKEVVNYRIDRLLNEEVIERFHTVINYFKIGVVKFKLYLRLTNIGNHELQKLITYLKEHEKTEWVAVMSGRWDLVVGLLVNNVNDCDENIQQILDTFSSYVQEKAVTTTLYLAHRNRDFVATHTAPKVVYHTTHDTQEKIDSVDYSLLQLLANNARLPVTELAEKLKTTSRVVQYRMKELERKKIILSYRAHVNPLRLGKIFCKALIYLGSSRLARLQELVNYTSSLEGAIWPQRVLGAWDFELDFELSDYDRFQHIIFELKQRFPDLIKNHEFCILSKEIKLDLFPGAKPTIH